MTLLAHAGGQGELFADAYRGRVVLPNRVLRKPSTCAKPRQVEQLSFLFLLDLDPAVQAYLRLPSLPEDCDASSEVSDEKNEVVDQFLSALEAPVEWTNDEIQWLATKQLLDLPELLTARSRDVRNEAAFWLNTKGDSDLPFTFDFCCRLCGLDAEVARAHVEESIIKPFMASYQVKLEGLSNVRKPSNDGQSVLCEEEPEGVVQPPGCEAESAL